MRRCLDLARRALSKGDVPVGALVVQGRECIAEGVEAVARNLDPLGHAEGLALQAACRKLGRIDLVDCCLYTTAEPCFMCSYAIRKTGIARVVIGLPVAGVGGASSSFPILTAPGIKGLAAPPKITWDVLAAECRELLETWQRSR